MSSGVPLADPRAVALSLWRHREIVWQLARRDVVARYRGSMLGMFWAFGVPLLMLAIYTFVFGMVFRVRWPLPVENGPSFALILFAGLVVYSLFSECVIRAPTLVLAHATYVKKIVFPIEILPWVAMATALFHAAISLVVLVAARTLLQGPPPWTRRLKERFAGVLGEDLAAFDNRFDAETALRCAACTYFFGVKDPGANQVIPAAVLEAHGRRPDLRARFPVPLDVGAEHNVLGWALGDEGLAEPAVAAWRATIAPFEKSAPVPPPEPESEVAPWRRRARAAGERLVAALDNGHRAGWTMEEITDGGERVTHLFPNDCFIAHRSLYHFAVPFVADAAVLDAGSGAGYGAAHLADRGARLVLGVDASPKAVAFSRHHFARPNLRYEVRDIERLRDLELRSWDVVLCSNVLEHVADADRFLRGVWGLLKADGLFILAVPPIVNESLRAQNLANQYHLNIWSPRQWAHALGRYFAEVETYQHWYEHPGVELNLSNTPENTVIREEDFVFRPVGVDGLYDVPTITAVFTARRPVAADALPAQGSRLSFVDDSFTRPPPPPRAPAPDVSLARRAWRALRRRVS